jgi:GAF domain-containing protein
VHVDTDAELSRLRVLLRDLVALTAIPGGWIGNEPREVAAGLVDALVALLQLDFGFVRLCDPGGADAADVTRGDAWSGFPHWLETQLAAGASLSGKQIIDDVAGRSSPGCVGIAIPIGVNGEGGMVAAACERHDFPDESEQLLLSLAANQASVAFQSARVIFERTAELRRSQAGLARLLTEQRALRRVATLAARQASQAAIFTAIAESTGELLGADSIGLLRGEEDGSAVIVALWGVAECYRVGFRIRADEESVTSRVLQTGRAARLDNLEQTTSPDWALARSRGIRSVVWSPVIVEGRTWGVLSAGTTGPEPMPPDTESRLGQFTELMATAIANSESRARADRLTDAQAALRRVATLAAHEASQEEIFTAIAESVAELLGSECSGLLRREADGSAVVVATWGYKGALAVGARIGAEEDSVSTRVFQTGGAVRVDNLDEATGDLLKATRSPRLRSGVGTPVTVEGSMWGAIVVGTTSREPMPPDTESRLGEFTELMATAIANSESRAEADRLTEAQAALRRMAILVAEDAPLADVFLKATEEAAHLMGDVDCGMCRDEGDGTVLTVGAWGQGVLGSQRAGERYPLDGISLAGRVLREGRYCQIDDYSTVRGTIAKRGKEHGIRSAAGCPIVVHGRAWGMIGVARYGNDPLPPETEARLAQLAGLVATAIANADARAETEVMAREQAALRRVATLVATDPPLSAEVFAKVAEEVTKAIGGVDCALARSEGDMTITTLAGSGTGPMAKLPIGEQFRVDGTSVVARVLREGGPCRIDDYSTATSGAIGERGREYGIRSAAGCPIVVHGDVWGVMSVATYAEQPLPRETERRLAQFTELVATAIANADAHAEIERLAREQAALRRVATLVAERASPDEVFGKVTEEVGRLVGADVAAMARYQDHDTARIVAAWGRASIPLGLEFPVQDGVTSRVGRTKRAERIDDYGAENVPAFVRDMGVRSAAGAPMVVAGKVWGALLVGSYAPDKWTLDAEAKIAEFTELAATAVSNMQSQADLAASRARIVTTADEARRRIERDLHDGVQQRLVSLALNLRGVERTVAEGDSGSAQLAELGVGLNAVLEELRELSRGIHPAILRDGGLDAAIRGLAMRSGVPVVLKLALDGPLTEPMEVAAYYVVSEALTNAAKHARASQAEVALEAREGALEVSIRDDGVGGAHPVPGSGLTGLSDRVEAIGGTITLSSPPGSGTLLRVSFRSADERVERGRDKQAERDRRRR